MTRWTDHVRAYAAAHNISYKQAVVDSKQSYDYNVMSKCPIKVRDLEHKAEKYKDKYKKCKRTLRGRVAAPAGPPPAPPPPPLPPPPPPRRKPGSPPSYEESKKDKYEVKPGPKYKKPKRADNPPGYDEKEEEIKGEPDQWNPPDYDRASRPDPPKENPTIFSGEKRIGNVGNRSIRQLKKLIKSETTPANIKSAAKKWLKWRNKILEIDFERQKEAHNEQIQAESDAIRRELLGDESVRDYVWGVDASSSLEDARNQAARNARGRRAAAQRRREERDRRARMVERMERAERAS